MEMILMCDVNERVFDTTVELKDNAMLKVRPELFDEWDFDKNDELGLNVYKVSQYNKINVDWECQKCGSHYNEKVYNRVRVTGCPYCLGRKVNYTNCLSTKNISLASEWHPTLNGELTPDEVYYRHKNKAWWKCPKCKSEYESSIYGRNSENYGCPYCAGQKVNHTNSLATLRPDLVFQWHPIKNGNLKPDDVTCGLRMKVWWLGNCGHTFMASIGERANRGSNCPYCSTSNAKVLKGFNDMWTTNPDLASLLCHPNDGYKYGQNSGKKVDWKCPSCGEIVKNKCISTVNHQGMACGNCSDGTSYPEKVVFNFLKFLGIDFEREQVFKWAKDKKYDFYIPSLSLIIETHGIQHFEEGGFSSYGSRTLKEEQENDEIKEQMAIKNKIKNYVIIDCRYSNFEFIKNNIIHSELSVIFELTSIDWKAINLGSQKSFNYEMLRLWNEDNMTLDEISGTLKIGNKTISRVLRNFENLGLCIYDGNRGRKRTSLDKTNKVYQLALDFSLIRIWNGARNIEEETGINSKSIYASIVGKQKTSHGFIWKYEKDLIGWSVPINK